MIAGKPLQGVRVVEFARVLAGPWAGQLLADLGADVIKVENPIGGDETRHWGPPFLEQPGRAQQSAAYFHSCNRGKRSVTLDLKVDHDLLVAKALCRQADVIIENFRVGTMDRLGLGFDRIAQDNEDIVYCSITGFGQSGPCKDRPGYDFIIQGLSGFMSITGEANRSPMKAGVAITDILTGLYAVSAINAALLRALKSGQGAHLDISLFEVMSASLANQNLNYLATGDTPQRLGNAHPNIAPYQVVPTLDGHVIIAVGNDGQFDRLCSLLELTGTAEDERFSSNEARVRNRGSLTEIVEAETRKWRRDALVQACENQSVPVGPINTIADMFEHPQIKARGLQFETDGGLPGVRSPVFIDAVPASHSRTSPALGEHNDAIKAMALTDWPSA